MSAEVKEALHAVSCDGTALRPGQVVWHLPFRGEDVPRPRTVAALHVADVGRVMVRPAGPDDGELLWPADCYACERWALEAALGRLEGQAERLAKAAQRAEEALLAVRLRIEVLDRGDPLKCKEGL